jgi:hypothetical protein
MITNIEEIKNKKLRRGGIIPFYYDHSRNEYRYIFGIDRKHYELTDFGGRREKKDKNIIYTAKREFKEETSGVFGEISLKGTELVIEYNNMMVIFYDLKYDPHDIINKFRNEFSNRETSDFLILNQRQIYDKIARHGFHPLFYSKTKEVLKIFYYFMTIKSEVYINPYDIQRNTIYNPPNVVR